MKILFGFSGIVIILLNGCCGLGTNHFEANYTGTYNYGKTTATVEPEVVLAANKSGYDTEVSLIKSRGATLLGTSFFNIHSYSMCESHLKSWAKKQGADFVVATREFTKQTRTMEPRQERVNIYNADGTLAYYYDHTVMREIVRNYYDYSATLLRAASAKPSEPFVP
tara:strand:- start:57 stop:557 length:501 start_codon:yes stop_codon:yes gene_type:complete